MKNYDYEKMSDRELLIEQLKCLQQLLEKLPATNNLTLAALGYMTNGQFMNMFNIKRGKADQLRRSGALPYSKMGGIIVYKISDVIEMLEKHKQRDQKKQQADSIHLKKVSNH